MNEKTKTRVLDALEGMHTIARAEMMQQVGYIDPNVNPHRRASACQGHQACAIGSLWLAAGIRPRRNWGSSYLPGTPQAERGDFIRNRPVLKHALNFLNEAASEYMERHAIEGNPILNRDAIESLFESEWFEYQYDNSADTYKARRAAMLKVISAAKRKVKAAA